MTLSDRVPDAKTVWNFRDTLDTSIVEVPKQRNTRDENKKIKEGEVPVEWLKNENKRRQKDTDAAWLKNTERISFG